MIKINIHIIDVELIIIVDNPNFDKEVRKIKNYNHLIIHQAIIIKNKLIKQRVVKQNAI